MNRVYIQKTDFSYAEDIYNILDLRVINVSTIESISENDGSVLSTSNNTYVCSSLWEEKLGSQQNLLDFVRKLKCKTVFVVHEKSENFKIEKHLGGNLVRFYLKEEASGTKIYENFQLQLLLSLIQSKDTMTAGDISSYQLLKLSKKVSEADVTVFINGPTGTGKEVLSRFIHKNSKRSDKPFVGINCAAIPENMLEAILFGHEKGAFTGASSANKGIFRAADNGTLLLDEVSEMPLSLQAKLLRVLQEKKVTPIGGQRDIDVNVRVIATTNRDMLDEVREKKFREDLYYRLNVFPIETHNLSERPDDILPISIALLNRHTENSSLPYINKDAQKILREYSWPGNVRELENVLQRAIVLCEKNIIEDKDIMIDVSKQSNFYNNIQENLSEKKLMQA